MSEKMKMVSPDMAAQNRRALKELFPACITEIQDSGGNLR